MGYYSLRRQQERYLNKHTYACAITSKPRNTGIKSMLKSISHASQKNTDVHK
jgi:hypothetical protein